VVWTHTIFRILEFFFPNASRNKLRVSTNLMILGATDQKLWVFKVFKRSLGRAGMCWSQWRVVHMRKKMGAGGRKRRGGSCTIKGTRAMASRRPLVAGQRSAVQGRLTTNGHLPVAAWAPSTVRSSNLFYFGTFEELPGILGEWVYNTPIFWSLPLHLEVLNLPFLMEIGDFTFFQI
jgi:hypothetical protein